MSRRVDVPPKKQFRRVAAWTYAVINPIIESLHREFSLLDSGNLTWRPYSRRCEMIKAIQHYWSSTQWPNYLHFLSEPPTSLFFPELQQHTSPLPPLTYPAPVL